MNIQMFLIAVVLVRVSVAANVAVLKQKGAARSTTTASRVPSKFAMIILKKWSPLTCLVVITLVVIVVSFCSLFKFNQTSSVSFRSIPATKEPAIYVHQVGPKIVKRKPIFIYLVQTEGCIPKHLLVPEFLGNPDMCSCEVYVLSFKTPCWQTSHSHIHYAFEKTSWSPGRNRIYELAKKERFDQVRYYIFMDDDIRLVYNGYTPEGLKARAPARVFEEWLLKHEPAVGVLDYGFYYGAAEMMKKKQKLCGNTSKELPLTMTVVHFDAAYNAIHRDASDHLLPYMTDFESTNWWHSQKYLILAAEITFRRQVVMFKPITGKNGHHSKYPQDDRDRDQVYSYYVKELVKRVPQQYHKEKFLTDLQANAYEKIEYSTSICLDLPPKQPIKPFAHFSRNLTGMTRPV